MKSHQSALDTAAASFRKPSDEMETWREQCRSQLKRDTVSRMKYGWVHTYKPVLDDAPYRIFKSTAEYRKWCKKNLPYYLGFDDKSKAV